MRLLDPASQPDAIEWAAQRLADGGLLALPTETVYGLGARADDDAAVARIFAAKGRPSNHPLIVHVATAQAAAGFASQLPEVAQRLMAHFWPGPLTVIVPRAPGVAASAAGGQDTIGLRCPDHPVALQLLHAVARLGVLGVAAPSANRFGRISPTRAEHVVDEFQDAGPGLDEVWVLQGGACEVGIESTIVDCSRSQPVILRPGRLTVDEIEAAAGQALRRPTPAAPDLNAPRAPGTLEAHYAPRAKLRLMSEAQLVSALEILGSSGAPRIAIYSRSLAVARSEHPGLIHRPMPDQALEAAHALFFDLRELDALGVDLIWVEQPPLDAAWDGVRDRLSRAAAA